MPGFLLASSKAGRNECSQPNPTRMMRSARFMLGTKLGFSGTPCVSSTPVARLRTLTWLPPMLRAKSARSVRVATTRISSRRGGAAEHSIAPRAARDIDQNSLENDFMRVSPYVVVGKRPSARLPSVRVSSDNPRPLDIDGVVVLEAGGLVVLRVSELQSELVPVTCRPGDVRGVRAGNVVAGVNILRRVCPCFQPP